MSLQCESTQRWRRENEEDGEGGLWVGRHGEEGRVWRGVGGRAGKVDEPREL